MAVDRSPDRTQSYPFEVDLQGEAGRSQRHCQAQGTTIGKGDISSARVCILMRFCSCGKDGVGKLAIGTSSMQKLGRTPHGQETTFLNGELGEKVWECLV